MEDNYCDTETFLSSIPAEFDAWNVSRRLAYYAQHVSGFDAAFTADQQVALASQLSAQQLRTLWTYYRAPYVLGILPNDLQTAQSAPVFFGWALENLRWILETLGVFDNNGTVYTPECQDFRQEFNQYITFLLIPTILFIALISFLNPRRSLSLHILWGRPSVQHPVDLVSETDKQWAYASAFVLMVYCLHWLFDSEPLTYPESYTGLKEEWEWNMVSVLLRLLNVLHVAVITYPLFESITLREHVMMNLVGIAYMMAWVYYMVRKYVACDPWEQYLEYVEEPRLQLALDLPNLAAILYLALSYTADLTRNVKKYTYKTNHESGKEDTSQCTALKYVRSLFRKRCPEIMPKWRRLWNSLSGDKGDGLCFSPRVTCTSVVAVLWISRLMLLIDSEARHIRGQIFLYLKRFKILIDILSPNPNRYEEVVETIETFFWSFYTALWCSFLIHVMFAVHMTMTYRKHLRLLFRGNHEWTVMVKESHASSMTAAMRYAGYQIAYLLFGFVLILVGQTAGGVMLAYLIIIPLKHGETNPVLDMLVDNSPMILVGTIIFLLQFGLVKFYFVQDRGRVLAMDNGKLYHVLCYFLLLPSVVVGVGSTLRRLLSAISFHFLYASRLDRCALLAGCERFDTGHRTYLGMLKVDLYHGHPVLKAFIILLQKQVSSQPSKAAPTFSSDLKLASVTYGTFGGEYTVQTVDALWGEKPGSPRVEGTSRGSIESDRRRSHRARLRWFKAYTLLRNPALQKPPPAREDEEAGHAGPPPREDGERGDAGGSRTTQEVHINMAFETHCDSTAVTGRKLSTTTL